MSSKTISQTRTEYLSQRGQIQTTVTLQKITHERLKGFAKTGGFSSTNKALEYVLDHALADKQVPASKSELVNQAVARFAVTDDRESLRPLMSLDEQADFDRIIIKIMDQRVKGQLKGLGLEVA